MSSFQVFIDQSDRKPAPTKLSLHQLHARCGCRAVYIFLSFHMHSESSAQMQFNHLKITFLLYRAVYVDLLPMHPMANNQIQKVKGEIPCILAILHEI